MILFTLHSTLQKIFQVDKMGRWENEEGKVGKARSCLPLIQGLLSATLRKYIITEIRFFWPV